jgi:mono/diheme cytochrome c family protein
MKRYNAISLIALATLVMVLPIYALLESARMDAAQAALRSEFVDKGAAMYVDNCATCHGADGQGLGAMPALNNPGLASADRGLLYQMIAHSPHGTAMAAWHVDEGGALNSYQVESLVTLITNADWVKVSQLADEKGFVKPVTVAPEEKLATMEGQSEDPHECRACHEEPALHAERFGLNCSRCHTLEAWTPALLTRHTFFLDHGDEGKVTCDTCHTETYAAHTCYGCHDHQPEEMRLAHEQEEIVEFEGCAECHPTGVQGEAARLGYGLSGQDYGDQRPAEGDEAPGDPIPPLDDPGDGLPGPLESVTRGGQDGQARDQVDIGD